MTSSEAQSNINVREQMNDNVASMRSLSSAAPSIKSAVASDEAFYSSLTSYSRSIDSDSYAVDRENKVPSLRSMARNVTADIPRLKNQAQSNSVEYRKLSMANDEMDGTDANIGAALANSSNSNEDNNFKRATQTSLFNLYKG